MKPALTSICACVVAVTLLVGTDPAQAGRPFVTEDAGVLDRGRCEWESLVARAASAGSPAEASWSSQVGCGIGGASQLALAYERVASGAERTGTATVSGKTALLDGGDDGVSLALAWGGSWVRSAGRTRADSALASLVATRPLSAGWTAHANLGLLRVQDPKETQTTWALALERSVAEGLDVGAETYGEGSGKPWLGAGLRWQVAEAWSVNGSAAVQRGSPRVKLFTLGFKLEF